MLLSLGVIFKCSYVFAAGFEILAFPCNQFAWQEPGTNEEIQEAICTRFKAEFPIFEKVFVFKVAGCVTFIVISNWSSVLLANFLNWQTHNPVSNSWFYEKSILSVNPLLCLKRAKYPCISIEANSIFLDVYEHRIWSRERPKQQCHRFGCAFFLPWVELLLTLLGKIFAFMLSDVVCVFLHTRVKCMSKPVTKFYFVNITDRCQWKKCSTSLQVLEVTKRRIICRHYKVEFYEVSGEQRGKSSPEICPENTTSRDWGSSICSSLI